LVSQEMASLTGSEGGGERCGWSDPAVDQSYRPRPAGRRSQRPAGRRSPRAAGGLAAGRRARDLPGAGHLGHRRSPAAVAAAAIGYRRDWLPHPAWVELDGVGHCPQLDAPLGTAPLILGFCDGG